LEKTIGGILIVINVHIHWNPEFSDVKLFQVILLLEAIQVFKEKYPSAGILLLGDFNSLRNSAVYEVVSTGQIKPESLDFLFYDYAPYFKEGFQHDLLFRDAYSESDQEFTNFTAHFKGILDYIFYNDKLILNSYLSPVDLEYSKMIVGLPSVHYPSDHLILGAKFYFKGCRQKKKESRPRITKML
ncbi:Glucose-repressible alcohol dehydrogenase transcriptional effector CCR4, partial [Pseudoloma neurophilia]